MIGFNPEFNDLSTIPLDRIDDLEPVHIPYIENSETDFDSYFDNVIGVTIPDAPLETIKLRFTPSRLQYVLTKPLHKSQVCTDPASGIIILKLIPNNETDALILSFGADVEVLEPESYRNRIREKVQSAFANYLMCRLAALNNLTFAPKTRIKAYSKIQHLWQKYESIN